MSMAYPEDKDRPFYLSCGGDLIIPLWGHLPWRAVPGSAGVGCFDDTNRRRTSTSAGACLNNLVLGLLIGKKKYPYLPSARRYYEAHPVKAFALIT